MAKAALKVFRTAIGFHDAYVAAPSQKAALAAWGSDTNLFAAKLAGVVTDPALTAAPLAHPGKVVKRSRGDLAANLAATPRKPQARTGAKAAPARKPAKPRPRPSRSRLDEAEAKLQAFEEDAERQIDEIRERERALQRERAELERRLSAARKGVEDRLDEARERYEAAMERWRSSD